MCLTTFNGVFWSSLKFLGALLETTLADMVQLIMEVIPRDPPPPHEFETHDVAMRKQENIAMFIRPHVEKSIVVMI